WAGFAAPWLGRFRPEPRLLLGLLGSAAAAGAVALFGSDPIGVGVGMFCFAAGVSLSAPAMIQTITGLAPAQRGSVTALYTFALFLGASLAPVLVAALASNRPAVDPVATAALCAVPILLLAAALVALASRRRTTATLGAA
ncbi:hypothetical protein OOT08_03435, partial [Leucobacter sp. M11]|nr:hypothetical protein [Leucobacter sp. M11]